MRPTLAIALLTVKHSVRSRLLIALFALVLLTVFGLPLTVRGDGTAVGEVRVLLSYTLGLSLLLLCVATAWAACGAVSQEIREKQIRLVVVKPVHRIQVWLGKWLGLLLLNAALLAVCGGALYGLMAWRLRAGSAGPAERDVLREEILAARRRSRPVPESIDEDVAARIARFRETGRIPPSMSDEDAYAEVHDLVAAEKAVVAPGAAKTWTFRPVARKHVPDGFVLRFRFSASYRDRHPVTGTWSIGTARAPGLFRHACGELLDGVHTVPVPSTAFRAGEDSVATFTNGPRGASAPIVFDLEEGVELLCRTSSFEANLARSLVVVFCHLGLLAAVGLTAGTLFSFPVAAFFAFATVLATILTHYSAAAPDHGAHHGTAADPPLLAEVGETLMRGLAIVVEPVMRLNPLGRLGDGILVSWGFTARAVLVLLAAYPLVLGALAWWVLRRRELALPG